MWLRLARQRIGDLRTIAIEVAWGVGKRKAAVGNLFECSCDLLFEENAAVKSSIAMCFIRDNCVLVALCLVYESYHRVRYCVAYIIQTAAPTPY